MTYLTAIPRFIGTSADIFIGVASVTKKRSRKMPVYRLSISRWATYDAGEARFAAFEKLNLTYDLPRSRKRYESGNNSINISARAKGLSWTLGAESEKSFSMEQPLDVTYIAPLAYLR